MKRFLYVLLLAMPITSFGQWSTGTNIYNTNTGYVGIGTGAGITPLSQLHVNSAIERQTFRIYRTGNTINYLSIWQGTGGAAIDPIGTGLLYLGYDLSTNVIIGNSGGNLGIGTSPSEKLEVKGNLRITGPSDLTHSELQFYRGSGNKFASIGQSDLNAANSPFDIREFNGNDIRFVTSGGNERLRIRSVDGNIGIGTIAPGSFKLAVNGKIWGTEVQVALTNPGPDYVFEPTYDLKPLAEIETYIKENKHLPEVPSAKEMEKNGVQLGELNMLLLKKIEELTLYVIEQQKINEAQAREIESLKKTIKK